MPFIPITTLDDPRIQVYRDLKGRPVTRQGDFFVVEGTKTVARLLDSDYETDSVLLIEKRVEEWGPRLPEDLPCYVLTHDLGSQLVGFNFHTGVVACGRRRPSPSLAEVLGDAVGPQTFVVCPNCDNPENLGAIIRIAAGFGVRGLLLGPACCDPFSRRVLRVSMGTAFRLPLVQSRNLVRDLRLLHDEWGFQCLASMLGPDVPDLATLSRPTRVALLLGNEDTGLDEECLALCDRRVTIPMDPGTDSLNVAVASGILLHHLTRVAPIEH